jgi:hypothetical protein
LRPSAHWLAFAEDGATDLRMTISAATRSLIATSNRSASGRGQEYRPIPLIFRSRLSRDATLPSISQQPGKSA